jgi:phenylacetate-CoA oxygenase PaaI subunit
MGSGIAEVCARAGLDVLVRETDVAAAEAGQARLVTSLDRGLASGKLTEAERDSALGKLAFTTDLGDFADTVLRNFLIATWLKWLWTRLAASTDADLAAIAGKAVKESRYHQQHAGDWVVRLGDGTEDELAARITREQANFRAWAYRHPTSPEEEALRLGNIEAKHRGWRAGLDEARGGNGNNGGSGA